MNRLTPWELANLWYLKFGYEWVVRNDLDKEWKNISQELMKNSLADYDLISGVRVNSEGASEIVKLKETCR